MNRRKTGFLYTVYTLTAIGVFAYFLFPSAEVAGHLAVRLEQAIPGVEISIGDVKPSLPPGLKLTDMAVYFKNDPVVDAASLTVYPGISSLWGDDLVLHFSCDAFDGEISGDARVGKDQPGLRSVDVKLDGLQLADVTALKRWVPHNLNGGITGSLVWQQESNGRSGQLNLRLVDGGVEFVHPVYGLDQVNFSAVEAGLQLKNAMVTIDRFAAKGPDLAANITGSVLVRTPPDSSVLNISGEMTPHAVFLDKLRKKVPIDALLKNKGGSGIPFRIGGTPRNPKFSLQ